MKPNLRELDVVRSAVAPVALLPQQRADEPDEPRDDSGPPIMTVRFSVFDTWYPIRSFWEGEFLERVARGAFAKTIAERGSQVKVLFNHGQDFYIGEKALGVPSLLEERDDSPYAEVPLDDTLFIQDIIPGLRSEAYGSSFMFNVIQDSWNEEPARSEYNPDGIPERTITEVRLLEFGPVTWPANPAATAGLRGSTDHFADKLRSRNPDRFEALTEQFAAFRAEHGLRTSLDEAALRGTFEGEAATNPTDEPDAPEAHHSTGLSKHARARLLAAPFLS